MLLRSFAVVVLVGAAGLVATMAEAETTFTPVALEGVSFADPGPDRLPSYGPFELSFQEDDATRFPSFERAPAEREALPQDHRRYEVSLGASSVGGLPVDVAVSQRASFGVDAAGNIARRGTGSELRLGRGVGMTRWATPSWDKPAWYFFLASDDEALTWRPGARTEFGGQGDSFALQDRVEIGDVQLGVTYEAGGLQASLAYVEREVSARTGHRNFSHDENFAGITITMRR